MGGGRGAYLRQRLGWIDRCWGSPLYPGIPAAGWGACLVSSGDAGKCQSTERSDLRSYGNKTKGQSAEPSNRRYTVKNSGHLKNPKESKYGLLTGEKKILEWFPEEPS